MDIDKKEIHIVPPPHIEQTARFVLIMLGVFLIVLTIGQVKGLAYVGAGIQPADTISVSGDGSVFAVPDVATFTYSVTETAKDVTTAQTAATKKANAILDYLKAQGVADTDVQTTSYNINPHYEYQSGVCTPTVSGTSGAGSSNIAVSPSYCPPGRSVITGYDVSQSVSVKVRDMSKAGSILAGVGDKGATNVSGLSLTVSNENALQIQARGKAIDDAKNKAQELAKQLGVSLVRIVGYSEGGGSPIYYAKAMDVAAGMGGAAPAPEIATGQNKLTSNVTITYEIR